jgi:outer membrane protein assembly factor BamA
VDAGDIKGMIFKKNTRLQPAKLPRFALLPSIGYNPSMGFIIGAKMSAGIQKGNTENTNYSLVGLEALYGSNGIITVQVRHNIFTAANSWNLQGNWQISKYGQVDYGLGTGNSPYRSRGFIIDEYPTKNGDSAFPIKYNYLRLLEKVYHKIANHLYAGVGISFDIYGKIADERKTGIFTTPHNRYSTKHGIDPAKYAANAWLLNLQYNTREHPVRSYGGLYADLSLRFNQEWLGSTLNAVQLQYDVRKYWRLSKKHPAHVIALWHWANYRLEGTVPYLFLPCTASDTYNRSGRGYTLGRFKGPSFAYFETEYRFPVTQNDLISGVCFFNLQTASNDRNKKLFNAWEPAAGAGLRILLQKQNRTTICIDYAMGHYGSNGIFFGLNEAF